MDYSCSLFTQTDFVCWNRPKTMENGFFVLAV